MCRKSSNWALTAVDLDSVQVEADSVLEIECIDDDMIGDELLGKLHFPLMEKLRELPPDARLATWDGDFPLTEVCAVTLLHHCTDFASALPQPPAVSCAHVLGPQPLLVVVCSCSRSRLGM